MCPNAVCVYCVRVCVSNVSIVFALPGLRRSVAWTSETLAYWEKSETVCACVCAMGVCGVCLCVYWCVRACGLVCVCVCVCYVCVCVCAARVSVGWPCFSRVLSRSHMHERQLRTHFDKAVIYIVNICIGERVLSSCIETEKSCLLEPQTDRCWCGVVHTHTHTLNLSGP